LFMRASNGQLFDFMAAPAAIPLVVPPGPLEADAHQPPPAPPSGPPPPPELATVPHPRRHRPRLKVIAVAAAVIVASIIAGVVVSRSDNGDASATTGPPTVPSVAVTELADIVLPESTTVLVAVDPPGPTCGDSILPGREAPPASLSPAELMAFTAVQKWHDLIASVLPATDSTSIWTAMREIYPNGPIRQDALTPGFSNLEANNLIFGETIDDVADGSGEISVLSLIYDNPTSRTTCRTGFQCLRYRVRQGAACDTFSIAGRSYASPVAESGGAYYSPDKWFAATDDNPIDRIANVADWMRNSCALATYRPQ
jgi:hypothetical protein